MNTKQFKTVSLPGQGGKRVSATVFCAVGVFLCIQKWISLFHSKYVRKVSTVFSPAQLATRAGAQYVGEQQADFLVKTQRTLNPVIPVTTRRSGYGKLT